MKNRIIKFLLKIIKLLNTNLKLKIREKTSVIDIHYENLIKDCYEFFKNDLKKASTFSSPKDIRNFAINQSLKNCKDDSNLFLECGVFRGESINFFADIIKKKKFQIYGFDSFEGLEEEWSIDEYYPVGTFTLNKKLPKVKNNVILIKGKVQDTLEKFLDKNKNKKIIFIHLDMDTYLPTKFTLEKIKPFLIKGSILIFDQFYGYANWQNHEYKAFIEVFPNKSEYKYLAFSEAESVIEIL